MNKRIEWLVQAREQCCTDSSGRGMQAARGHTQHAAALLVSSPLCDGYGDNPIPIFRRVVAKAIVRKTANMIPDVRAACTPRRLHLRLASPRGHHSRRSRAHERPVELAGGFHSELQRRLPLGLLPLMTQQALWEVPTAGRAAVRGVIPIASFNWMIRFLDIRLVAAQQAAIRTQAYGRDEKREGKHPSLQGPMGQDCMFVADTKTN